MANVMAVMATLDGNSSGMVRAYSQAERAMGQMADRADAVGSGTAEDMDHAGRAMDELADSAEVSARRQEQALNQTRDEHGRFIRSADDAADRGTSAFERGSKGIKAALGPIAAILAGAFAVDKIIDFGKQAIGAASDLNEAGTAVGAVFGPAMGNIEKWASTAATGLGQSKLQALDAAKTFGVYGQQAGLAADANADFSMNLTGLASDLASFHNADPSEVIEALGAGLRGEAEPLRKYGILMNDASLEAAALAAGIIETSRPLTAQEKILAANALVFQQAGAAMGDFSRTSDGLANQTRIAEANWTNLSGTIGTAFLPVVQTAAQVLNATLFPALQAGADALNTTLGPALEGVSAKIGPALSGLGPAVGDAFGKMVDAVGPVVSMFAGVLGPVLSTLGPQVLELVATLSPMGLVFKALTPVLPIVASLLMQVGTILTGALGQALPIISKLVQQLAETLSGALGAALPIVGMLLASVAKALSLIMPVVLQVADAVGDVLITALNAVVPLFEAIVPIVSQLLNALMPLIPPILGIVEAFLPLIDVIGQLIGAILPPVISLLMAVLTPIMALIQPILGLLAPALQFLADVLTTVVTWISTAITWLVNLATGGDKAGKDLGKVFDWLYKNAIKPATDGIGAAINWVGSLVSTVFSGINAAVNLVGSTIASVFGAIGGFISNAFSGALGVVRGAINGIIGLVNGAITALNGLSVTIPDFVPVIGGQQFGVSLPTIPYLARGGDVANGGLSWVGEHGPELLYLPTGAQVTPASKAGQTSSTAGVGGGDTFNITNHITVPPVSPAEVARYIAQQQAWQLQGLGATA